MKVTFGRKVLDLMPVTARETLLHDTFAFAMPINDKLNTGASFNHLDRYNDMTILAVPSAASRYYGPCDVNTQPVVKCDQMFKCHIQTKIAPEANDDDAPLNRFTAIKVDAELVDGATMSASELLSTHVTNGYVPNEITSAIRDAIVAVAIDTMKAPTD